MKILLPVIALTFTLATWSAPQALADSSSNTASCDTSAAKKHHHKKCCHEERCNKNKDKAGTSTNSAPSE